MYVFSLKHMRENSRTKKYTELLLCFSFSFLFSFFLLAKQPLRMISQGMSG